MDNLEKIFKALADKNRMRIIKLLQKRKMCVCELTYILGITQPSVSRHLKKLKACGLIAEEKNGYWKDYFITRNGNSSARGLLKCLAGWLNDDPVVKRDIKRLSGADREKLCCT